MLIQLLDLVGGALQFLQDQLHSQGEGAAGFGQRHSLTATIDQLGFQDLFQFTDGAAHRRLRLLQRARRPANTATADHLLEDFQLL
ncbi:hypothetical protein D3C75_1222110 [compost metagenome]